MKPTKNEPDTDNKKAMAEAGYEIARFGDGEIIGCCLLCIFRQKYITFRRMDGRDWQACRWHCLKLHVDVNWDGCCKYYSSPPRGMGYPPDKLDTQGDKQ